MKPCQGALTLAAAALVTACHHRPAAAPAPGAPSGDYVAPLPAAPGPSLYQRLGGQAALVAVVDTFASRVHGDPRISGMFRGVDIANFKRLLVEQLCQASGGPCTYTGRSMRAAHEGLGITNAQFDALVGHLVTTLDQFNVPAREKNELLALLAPLRREIVGH